MNLHDPGFLQTSGFSTVKCPVLLWVWLQFELVCDGPRNTVLMTFSLLFRRKRLRKRWKSWQILWRWPPWMQRWWS